MKRYWHGPTKNWQVGNIPLELLTLPPGTGVRKIQAFCNFTGSKDAADTVDGINYGKLITSFQVGPYFKLTGFQFQKKLEHDHGRRLMDPTDIPGSGTSFDIDLVLEWRPRLSKLAGANDGTMPTAMLKEHAVEVDFAAANALGVGNVLVTGGSVRLEAELVDLEPGYVPMFVKTGYKTYGQQTIPLEPGIYTYLALLQQDLSAITEAEVASVTLLADGKPYLNNIRHDQLVAMYNSEVVEDAASELTIGASTWLPLHWTPRRHGQLSKSIAIDEGGEIQLTGSASSFILVYEKAIEKDPSLVADTVAASGGDATASYKPASAKGSPIEAVDRSKPDGSMPRKGRILFRTLPGKFKPAA